MNDDEALRPANATPERRPEARVETSDATPPTTIPRRSRWASLRWLRATNEVRLLVLLAVLVRGLAVIYNPAILNDSVGLLDAARRAGTEGWSILLSVPQHPLPPALIALASRVADPELAATLLSLIGSSIAVWPLHAVARRACGRHAATAACLLYVALPKAVEMGTVPLTEGFFLPFFLGALALAVAARDCARGLEIRRLLGSGLCAGAAFLCRPEALVVLPGAVAMAVLTQRAGRLRRTGLLLAGLLLLAVPYVGLLSAHRGHFVLTPKKDVIRFAGLAPVVLPPAAVSPAAAPEAGMTGATFAQATRGTVSAVEGALGVPLVVLVLLGAAPLRRWRRRRARRPRALLAGTALLLLALVFRLRMGWGYGGGRHVLGAAVLLLPFAGEGLAVLGRVLPRVTSRRRFALFVASLLAIPLASRAILRAPGEGGVPARRLGEELARHEAGRWQAEDRLVVASIAEPRVAYYLRRGLEGIEVADLPLWGRYVRPLQRGADRDLLIEALEAELVRESAAWLVVDLFRSGQGGRSRELVTGLRARGRLGDAVVAAGSELAAFPVVR